MHRLCFAALLAGILLAPLSTEADARPIIIVEHGHHHGGGWAGPRWAPVVVAPVFPPPVLLPPVVVPQFLPVAVPVPVAPVVPLLPVGVRCGE